MLSLPVELTLYFIIKIAIFTLYFIKNKDFLSIGFPHI